MRPGNFTVFSTVGGLLDLELEPSGRLQAHFQPGNVSHVGLPRPGSQFRDLGGWHDRLRHLSRVGVGVMALKLVRTQCHLR